MRAAGLFIFLLTMLLACDTESNLEPYYEEYFIKYYGLEGDQIGVDLLVNDDNTFLLLGSSMRTDGNSQIMLTKADELGNEIWSYTYGESQNEYAKSVILDPSGNILIAAVVEESDGGKTNGKIFKLNAEGALLDSTYIGTDGFDDDINGITVTQNQELIVVGSTENVLVPGGSNTWDIFSIRMTLDLDELPLASWRRFYGYNEQDFGVQAFEKADGSFLFYGTTNRFTQDNSQQDGFNMFVFPTDNTGIVSGAEKYFGTLDNQEAIQMIETSDGGFAMIGTTTAASGGNSIYISRIRSNNDFLNSFQLSVNSNIRANSIAESSGDYIISGTVDSNGTTDIYLARVSSAGVIKWENSFGGADLDTAGKLVVLNDGSIVTVGTIELESQTKMCLIKTNNFGLLEP
ncbi:hypothetical protein [Fulvivirga lutimaris]|uniref:hypothetical protein n=1 Tax=Fulvivirga lutimaris TaxID=1819566 RepID=UPI0012BC64BE|nr:hypothetical protein [Fulvivirga lutimaris]MTI38017.1 hypothetical protein [Fulvivirga lutimaris]